MQAVINTLTKRRTVVTFFNFFLLAALGTLIRFHFYEPIAGVNLTNLHHAHSHLAFLGWVFMALFVLITQQFLSKESFSDKSYSYLFWVLQAANIGMLVTFPFMGYAPWSIAFSTIHTICAVIFTVILISDLRKQYKNAHWPMSAQFLMWALFFMLLSNLAPFAIGPVTSVYGKSEEYYLLINSYLHFQYNGWFTFALLGLFIRLLENKGINTRHRMIKWGLYLKVVAIFPILSISILSSNSADFWFILTVVFAVIQLAGLLSILVFFWKHSNSWIKASSKRPAALATTAFVAVFLQHFLQVLGGLPSSVNLLLNRQVVIAYLHLVFIGFVTVLLLHQFISLGYLQFNKSLKVALAIFLSAFYATEIVLIVRVHVPAANMVILALAVVQFLGVIIMFFRSLQLSQKNEIDIQKNYFSL